MSENFDENLDEYYVQALMLAEVVKRILERKGEITFSAPVNFKRKAVTQFMKRMRVVSVEKFDTATYISSVNFYRSYEDYDKKRPIGLIVLYLEGDYIGELMGKLKYTIDDEESPSELEAACGTFCNLIAGNFKSGLTQLGYQDLEMSHFSVYRNEVVDGVEYPGEQKEKYEMSFEIKGKIRIYADLVMGKLIKKDR
ncbi:MAG: hypothetical protein HQL27_07695 [Candidatus Omnitrophica bacterium]|nr:hypothetical protein [Candidatus Omnitrophota bacterium]